MQGDTHLSVIEPTLPEGREWPPGLLSLVTALRFYYHLVNLKMFCFFTKTLWLEPARNFSQHFSQESLPFVPCLVI